MGSELLRPVHVVGPGARAAIETTIALSTILSAGLFLLNLRHTRRWPDLLPPLALVTVAITGFVYFAGPVLAGQIGLESGGRPRLAVELAPAAVLLASALAFLTRGRHGERGSWLLAAAAFLLAAVRMGYLVTPAVATNWITPQDGLRLTAYAVLLAGVLQEYASTSSSKTWTAMTSDRERIAQDLHDGLAQDLACITAQGQRLGSELGAEHPLIVAARHALAASRTAITDLSASAAPTTATALRLIADELEHRHDVEVDIRMETDTTEVIDSYVGARDRYHLIRITREAIVNAILHGVARHIEVSVVHNGSDLVVRVSDDGRAIREAGGSGFGLRTVQAVPCSERSSARAPVRSAELELELVVS
jgi:signal transduction histidine kinase